MRYSADVTSAFPWGIIVPNKKITYVLISSVPTFIYFLIFVHLLYNACSGGIKIKKKKINKFEHFNAFHIEKGGWECEGDYIYIYIYMRSKTVKVSFCYVL